MIHLFKKVYLEPNRLFKTSAKRIVLSRDLDTSSVFENGLLKSLVGQKNHKEPMYKAHSYQELIATQFQFPGNDIEFFRVLLSDTSGERITIFADLPDLLAIHAKVLKALYPHWTSKDYIEVVRMYILTYEAKNSLGVLSYNGEQDKEGVSDTFLGELKTCTTPEYLHELWEFQDLLKFSESELEELIQSTSVELQLATLITNPDWKHRQQTEQKLVRLVQKFLLTEVISNVSKVILNNLPNFKQLEPTSSFDVFTNSAYDIAVMHRDYRFLYDENFKPDNIDYVLKYYDFDTLKQIYDKVASVFKGRDYPYSVLFKNNLYYQDIVNSQTDILVSGEYADSVNPYIMTMVMHGHTNNLGLIKRLEIKER
jgi:hypothetical protein